MYFSYFFMKSFVAYPFKTNIDISAMLGPLLKKEQKSDIYRPTKKLIFGL